MRDDIDTLHRIIKTMRDGYVLDDSVFEVRIVLREQGDPFLGFGFGAAGASDGVACFEVGQCDGGADEPT